MSSVTSEPISNQSLFNEEEGCYINGIQYEEKQTYTNFHKDIIKFFKESGTPEIKTIYPWQFNDEKQGYVTSYSTLYEDYKMNVVMFYDSGNKVCVIRVFTAEV